MGCGQMVNLKGKNSNSNRPIKAVDAARGHPRKCGVSSAQCYGHFPEQVFTFPQLVALFLCTPDEEGVWGRPLLCNSHVCAIFGGVVKLNLRFLLKKLRLNNPPRFPTFSQTPPNIYHCLFHLKFHAFFSTHPVCQRAVAPLRRLLVCGHTYCEICLNRMIELPNPSPGIWGEDGVSGWVRVTMGLGVGVRAKGLGESKR